MNSSLPIKIVFFSFFCFNMFGQNLHHQMISSQGSASKLKSGHYVTQTIGQQSTIGNSSSKNFKVTQGFQQSAWAKLIASTILPEAQNVTAFPNPFIEVINFQFGSAIEGQFEVYAFDTVGRLVASRKAIISNNRLSVNLYFLPTGLYLIQLKNNNIIYYAKIIKK